MKCRVCETDIENYEEVSDIEMNANTLYSQYTNTKKCNIKLYQCPICTHIQAEYVLEDGFYEKYNILNMENQDVGEGGNSVRRRTYYKEVLKNLKTYGVDIKRFIDMGCGRGTILKMAEAYFEECIGVEPSIIEKQVATEQGCYVINTFFDKNFKERDFSAFISTQVFEHLTKPREIIRMVSEVLKEGGVGYIDVPNGYGIYTEKRYFELLMEHINYFTIGSLTRLITEAGMEIISIEEVSERFHIGVYFRKSKTQISFTQKREEDRTKVEKRLKKYNRVGFWGAGIKGRNFIKLIDNTEKISYIFDSDKSLEGLFVGNCKIPISIPTKECINECDLIVITALEYVSEIMKLLKEEFCYRGKVETINEIH